MKKVTNCFMSKGNLSRVRALLNGVMSMNSCRMVLIALLMLFCGSEAMLAQLADGDIVTISVTTTDWRGNVTYHYLSAVENQNTVTDKTTPDEYSLWRVTVANNQYTFENVGGDKADGSNAGLRVNNDALQINSSASGFQFGTRGHNPGENQTEGRLYYYLSTANKNSRYKYINYGTSWGISAQKDEKQNTPSLLTIEKWTRKEVKGGLKGSFSPTEDIEFKNFDQTDAAAHATTVNFTIKRTAASTYYQCVNRADAKIDIESNTQNDNSIELSMLSVSWQSTPQHL